MRKGKEGAPAVYEHAGRKVKKKGLMQSMRLKGEKVKRKLISLFDYREET